MIQALQILPQALTTAGVSVAARVTAAAETPRTDL